MTKKTASSYSRVGRRRLQRLADKHKDEWEILPDQTYDDKKGFRRYWGILSKRLDQEVKDSFRIGDVVRFGGMVRNGIDEGLAVGFDMFTYAVLCANGSIGRGEGLGGGSWAHLGKVDLFEKRVLEGLEEDFQCRPRVYGIHRKRKQDQNDQRTHIQDLSGNWIHFRQTLQ